MKPSEIAEGTADVLRRYGWRTGRYGNHLSGYCLVGAARTFTGENINRISIDALTPGLPESTKENQDVYSIIEFNDHKAQSIDDVLDFCDRAAKYWRNQGR